MAHFYLQLSNNQLLTNFTLSKSLKTMELLKKPETITDKSFSVFMINTLSHALISWIEAIPDGSLRHDAKSKLNNLSKALTAYFNNVTEKKIGLGSNIEDSFFEVGDEFQAIMAHIAKKNKPGESSYNLYEICLLFADGTVEDIKNFCSKVVEDLEQ